MYVKPVSCKKIFFLELPDCAFAAAAAQLSTYGDEWKEDIT
jgi:hypothetical protein